MSSRTKITQLDTPSNNSLNSDRLVSHCQKIFLLSKHIFLLLWRYSPSWPCSNKLLSVAATSHSIVLNIVPVSSVTLSFHLLWSHPISRCYSCFSVRIRLGFWSYLFGEGGSQCHNRLLLEKITVTNIVKNRDG